MSKTIEILKFLRVSPEKKRLIQVRGKLFSSVDDIPDERVQHVVRQSIAEMVEMAGGIDQLIDGGYLEAPSVPLTEFLGEPDVTPEVVREEVKVDPAVTVDQLKTEETNNVEKEVEKSVLSSLLVEKDVDRDLLEGTHDSNSGSLLNRFRSLTGRQTETIQSIVPKLDIAGQINDILQGKVEGNQAYVGRQVELRSALNGDLLFIVDGRSFDSVNDIQEESIADLFKAAIAEWES